MQPIGVVGEPFRGSVRLRRIPDFEEEYVAALESWRDGSARGAILEFVRSVTEPGPGFVPELDRIATFDNDGTLWCEKPMYVQADFVIRKWRAMAASDPSLAERQPYKALVEGDREWLSSLTDHVPDLVRGV